MKAVVFHGIGDIRLDTVRDPKLEKPTDALIRIRHRFPISGGGPGRRR